MAPVKIKPITHDEFARMTSGLPHVFAVTPSEESGFDALVFIAGEYDVRRIWNPDGFTPYERIDKTKLGVMVGFDFAEKTRLPKAVQAWRENFANRGGIVLSETTKPVLLSFLSRWGTPQPAG